MDLKVYVWFTVVLLLYCQLDLTSSSKLKRRRKHLTQSSSSGSLISVSPEINTYPNSMLNRNPNAEELSYTYATDNYNKDLDTQADRVKRADRSSSSRADEEEDDDYDDEKARLIELERQRRQSSQAGPGQTDVLLPEGYSIYEIPKDPEGNPIPLYVFVNIINILDFDEIQEILQLDMEFSVMWTDYKIMYFNNKSDKHNHLPTIDNLTKEEIREKRKTLNNPFILDKIWKPNLFVENLLSVRQPALMARPLTIKVIPEVGWFEYITRITVKLDCEMDFHKYPADTQECEFSIRGFSYPKKDLRLNWYKNGAFLNDLSLPSFDVMIKNIDKEDWYMHKESEENDPEDIFEVLTFIISARRRLSYHFVQTYLASTFYIIITTLCFLLPARMIEARIGITMTTLLTLTAMFASVRESTPIVSYVKAVDIWMVGCIFFVFLVLTQFTVHTWITGGKSDEQEKVNSRQNSIKSLPEEKELLEKEEAPSVKGHSGVPGFDTGAGENVIVAGKRKSASSFGKYNAKGSQSQQHSRLYQWAEYSETYSFPVFLTIFAAYTTIYWTWLLVTADYFNWHVNSTLNDVVDFSDD